MSRKSHSPTALPGPCHAQQRPRSVCAFAQSNQGLRCPLTELLDTTKCETEEQQMPRSDFMHAWDESQSEHFAHARRHIFAWHGPPTNYTKTAYLSHEMAIETLEPERLKTYLRTCVSNDDSNRPDQNLRCPHEETLHPGFSLTHIYAVFTPKTLFGTLKS